MCGGKFNKLGDNNVTTTTSLLKYIMIPGSLVLKMDSGVFKSSVPRVHLGFCGEGRRGAPFRRVRCRGQLLLPAPGFLALNFIVLGERVSAE